LESLESEVEEAAALLGAGRMRTFVSVVAPMIFPTILTGFALSFARAIGEFGSVIFISSNIQYKTEIAPLLIFTYLEEFQYQAAMGVATVLLVISFLMLGCINLLERWANRFQA
jgi:sulfate/thiosulfate transport system permease protein